MGGGGGWLVVVVVVVQEPRGSSFSCNPRFPRPRAERLPGILSEWGPLIPIWEAKQGDGSEQPFLLLLLSPKQVLSLQGMGKETGRCGGRSRWRGLGGWQATLCPSLHRDFVLGLAGRTPTLKQSLPGQVYMNLSWTSVS